MAIIVVPSSFVLVMTTVGSDFLEGRGEVVVNEPGFELGSGDARRGADDKNRDQSALNSRSLGPFDDLGRQIKHLTLPPRFHLELLRKNRHE